MRSARSDEPEGAVPFPDKSCALTVARFWSITCYVRVAPSLGFQVEDAAARRLLGGLLAALIAALVFTSETLLFGSPWTGPGIVVAPILGFLLGPSVHADRPL